MASVGHGQRGGCDGCPAADRGGVGGGERVGVLPRARDLAGDVLCVAAPLSASMGSTGLEPRSRAPQLEPAADRRRRRGRDRGVAQGARRARCRRRAGHHPVASRPARPAGGAVAGDDLADRWSGAGSWSPSPASGRSRRGGGSRPTAPNELWQADCIDWVIATGPVKILSFLDDHSRVALRVKALPEATSEATWDAFCEATERLGCARWVSSATTASTSPGRLRGFEVHFETQLRAIGVVPKTSRPYHPQTCGKVERFQQTLKKWLRRQPLAADLVELQAQLDAFVDLLQPPATPPRHRPASPPPSDGPPPHPPSTSASPCPAPPRPPPSPSPQPESSTSAATSIGIGSQWARPHRPRPPRRHPRRRVHRPPPRPRPHPRPHPPLPALRTPPRPPTRALA